MGRRSNFFFDPIFFGVSGERGGIVYTCAPPFFVEAAGERRSLMSNELPRSIHLEERDWILQTPPSLSLFSFSPSSPLLFLGYCGGLPFEGGVV